MSLILRVPESNGLIDEQYESRGPDEFLISTRLEYFFIAKDCRWYCIYYQPTKGHDQSTDWRSTKDWHEDSLKLVSDLKTCFLGSSWCHVFVPRALAVAVFFIGPAPGVSCTHIMPRRRFEGSIQMEHEHEGMRGAVAADS